MLAKTTPKTRKPDSKRIVLQRLVRLPFSSEEDDDIRYCYEVANGAVLDYPTQARQLNERYHGGKPIRSPSAVRRREGKILRGLA